MRTSLIGALVVIAVCFGVAVLIDVTTDTKVAYFLPAVVAGGVIIGSMRGIRSRR